MGIFVPLLKNPDKVFLVIVFICEDRNPVVSKSLFKHEFGIKSVMKIRYPAFPVTLGFEQFLERSTFVMHGNTETQNRHVSIFRHRLKRSKSWTAGDSKFEDDDIMRAELYGDESTEPFSEPQNLSSKSAGNDKPTELTTINKYGSKRKKKFKRRHTEMAFGWQSSETDIPPRSDESMVANSE